MYKNKIQKFLPVLIVVLGAASVLTFILFNSHDRVSDEKNKFVLNVKECNIAEIEHRFSCYRNAIEKYYQGDLIHLKEWIEADQLLSFEGEDISYAIFGTNCHTFYHAMGDFIATKEAGGDKDTDSLVNNYCSTACTSGCLMGLYKRTALIEGYPSDLLRSFYEVCPEESGHQCAHEIGHILHDKYTYSILQPIDDLSRDRYALELNSYRYATFEYPNLMAPFEECETVVPENIADCFTGVGHNMFVFAQFTVDGYRTSYAECEKLPGVNRDRCYDFLIYRIGINDAATKFLSGTFEEGRSICNEVAASANRDETKKHCYRGIGGGLGLFLDSEYANLKITSDNLAHIQRNVLERINLCEESEEEWKSECYRGLLGTRVKKLYIDLNLYNNVIEKILPQITSDFEVVG
jgi:hypothetical protein